MDDALAMRGLECVRNLESDPHRRGRGHRSGERRAVDVFHDEVIAADVVQRADVRVIEARDRSGLALDRFTRHTQPLNRDDPIEPAVSRLPHVSHGTGTDFGDEDIRADLASRLPDGHSATTSPVLTLSSAASTIRRLLTASCM